MYLLNYTGNIIMCSLNDTFVMDKELRAFHSAMSLSLGILGTLGNFVSIFLIVRNQLYSNCTVLMIVNLCVANLVSTALILPVISASNFYQQRVLGEEACRAFAYVMYVVITAECLVLMHITVGQYLAIIHNVRYQKCRVKVAPCLLLSMPWIVALCIYIIPLAHAWDEFGYDPRRGYCTMLHIDGSRSFHSVLSIFFISVMSTVTIYCYASIYYVHFKSHKKIQTSAVEATTKFRGQARNTQLIKMITVILINYAITYIPFLIISIFDPCAKKSPLILYSVIIYMSWSHTATNPVIYALMNTKINAVWRQFLSCGDKCNRTATLRNSQAENQMERKNSKNILPPNCVKILDIE